MTPDDDLMTVAEAVDWLAGQPATLLHRDSAAIMVLDAGHLDAFRRLLAGTVLTDAERAGLDGADLDPLLVMFGLDPAAVWDAADLADLELLVLQARAARDSRDYGDDLMPVGEAVELIAARPGIVATGVGALIVCGAAQLTALGKLLAAVDADTVPDGADLELFAMLTGAARGAP